jgi:hypothetical protein
MRGLVEHFERQAVRLPAPSGLSLAGLSIIVSPPHHLMGLHLGGGEFLVLQSQHYYSFRVRLRNLEDVYRCRTLIAQPRGDYDLEYLRRYFDENMDNPFAIQHVFRCLKRDEAPLADLTQFPPLFPEKNAPSHALAVDALRERAASGNILFSFHRKSGISQLIRKYDRSQWSHCCMVAPDKSLVDATTAGVIRASFADYADPEYDLGLYRFRGITREQGHAAAEIALAHVGIRGYGYYAVFRLYLRNRWGIPFHVPSVSDIIYSNQLDLVGYC